MTYKDNSGHKTILGPAAFILGLAISGLTAVAANAGEITVSNATAHVMEDPVNGRRIEVYMDIENSGGARDRLYSVRSKLSGKTMLSVIQDAGHSANGSNHDGMGHPNLQMHMPTTVLDVPAGTKVELRHGNSHIMLMEPKDSLAVGDTFPVTLFFERAGRISVEATIVPMDMSH